MKSVIIVFFSILVLFEDVKSNEAERIIEERIRQLSHSDPSYFPYVNAKPGNGVLQVNQKIYNIVVTGLRNSRIKVKADLKAGNVFLSYENEQLTAYVDYDLDGSCLLMPIWGKGKGVVVMNDVGVTANATVKTVDGIIKIIDMKITYDLSGGSFRLSSLFGEFPPGILTSLYVKVFNANAKYIFNEIIPSYIPTSETLLSMLWEIVMAG